MSEYSTHPDTGFLPVPLSPSRRGNHPRVKGTFSSGLHSLRPLCTG
jgi:hypothetical protein